ncbi:MAG: MBL fold metallo-hydrolase [Desulfovibrionaceae bacterium]|nr:MBL fold metallo-hydrolase [Desulfovibrionaceae bacterium]
MSKTWRISVLCDDRAVDARFGTEWGLALAIERKGELWLWDTGQSGLFLKNAARLSIDVEKAEGLCLSHGHYDHTGGMDALFAATKFRGPVFAHPEVIRTRYSFSTGKAREIGVPGIIPEFIQVRGKRRLDQGLWMLTDVPRMPGMFQGVGHFSYDRERTAPDPVPDDSFLVLETESGPVAVLGCCHSGLFNSLAYLREALGHKKVRAVVGGLHLIGAPQKALEETAKALLEFEVRTAALGHCTGKEAVKFLKARLALPIEVLSVGLSLEF